MKTAFVADMHLKPGGDPVQAERLPLFFESLRLHAIKRLVLLGDTFHCWCERRGRVVGEFDDILSHFRQAADSGMRIYHVSGNRDFLVGAGAEYPGYYEDRFPSRLSAYGITPCGPFLHINAGDCRILCLHGDTLCSRDTSYQRMRALFHSPVGKAFAHLCPWPLLQWSVSRVQNSPLQREYLSPPPECDIVDEAALETMRGKADMLLCGHVHHATRRDLTPDGAALIALPPWLVKGEYALHDGCAVSIVDIKKSGPS